MIPYDNFPFFLWLLIPVIPAIILGLVQASPRTRSLWIMHLSIGMLYFILSPRSFFVQAIVYFIWEYLIIRFYLQYRQSEKTQNRMVFFYLAIAGSLLPLILVKLSPLIIAHFAQTTSIGSLAAKASTTQNVTHITKGIQGLSGTLSNSQVPSGSQVLPQISKSLGQTASNQGNYIIYGLYMALLMIGFEFLERFNKKKNFWGNGKAWDILARFLTLQFICFGLLIFSGRLG